MSDATYAKHAVVANLDPLVPNTQWALIERAFRGGSGLLVRFDARLLPGVARLFERLAALGDPQIASPAEHGVDDDEAWLIYGGTLDDALDALSGPLSMGEIAQLGDALIAGLERAHDQGILHPGISPSLVRMHIAFDGRVHPELLGLGLPSPVYRTVQDDLADLAALLYTLYTGRPPFEPGVPRDGTVSPKPFADTRPSGAAPQSFENAILRALGPRASAFWTAAEMRAALTVNPTRRSTGARLPSVTDPNLPRLQYREVSRVAPLPIAAPVPAPSLPPEVLSERPMAAIASQLDVAVAPKTRNWWPLVALLVLGVGVALGFALAGGSDASPTRANGLAQSAPIESSPPPAERVAEPVDHVVVEAPKPAIAAPKAEPVVVTVPVPVPAPMPAAVDRVTPAPVVAAPVVSSTRFAIRSEPSDSAVTMNGKIVGRTPYELDVNASDLPVRITVERKGMLPAVRTIEKLDAPSEAIAITLRPRPTKTAGPTPTEKPPEGGTILLGR